MAPAARTVDAQRTCQPRQRMMTSERVSIPPNRAALAAMRRFIVVTFPDDGCLVPSVEGNRCARAPRCVNWRRTRHFLEFSTDAQLPPLPPRLRFRPCAHKAVGRNSLQRRRCSQMQWRGLCRPTVNVDTQSAYRHVDVERSWLSMRDRSSDAATRLSRSLTEASSSSRVRPAATARNN